MPRRLEPGSIGQLFLGQTGRGTMLTQQHAETAWSVRHCHFRPAWVCREHSDR